MTREVNIICSEIKEQIELGLKEGYNQGSLLLGSYDGFIEQIREYILTVYVAQQLLNWSKLVHKIHLEYPIRLFYDNAFESVKLASGLKPGQKLPSFKMSYSKKHSPTKRLNQKVDIVITKKISIFQQDNVIAGIELKAINKNRQDIIKDAKRMSDAMTKTNQGFVNSIDFCFCGFLKRFDKNETIVDESFIHKKEESEQRIWSEICCNLMKEYPTLEFTIESFDVAKVPLESIRESFEGIDTDYSEVASNTGAVIGYIMTIKRNETLK